MNQKAKIVNLGFSTADAEDIKFSFDGSNLKLEFIDWQEETKEIVFKDVIAYNYQLAEKQLLENERYDSTHIILNSEWLKLHKEQNEAWPKESWAHYKLNFNAGGIVELICPEIKQKNS